MTKAQLEKRYNQLLEESESLTIAMNQVLNYSSSSDDPLLYRKMEVVLEKRHLRRPGQK